MNRDDPQSIRYRLLEAPFGQLLALSSGGQLRELRFQKEAAAFELEGDWREGNADDEDSELLDRVQAQLSEYYAGRRREFELRLDPIGTPFQRLVWEELGRIAWGETISYGTLAARIGKPSAARAVGAANGKNPIPIVIPCHRVIGSDGSLTGFGGGLAVKECLLRLEGRQGSFRFC